MKAPLKKAGMFDLAVPFFLPVWRRMIAAGLPILWAFFEFSTGQVFWGLLFLGMGGIAAWKFWTADWSAVAAMDKDA